MRCRRRRRRSKLERQAQPWRYNSDNEATEGLARRLKTAWCRGSELFPVLVQCSGWRLRGGASRHRRAPAAARGLAGGAGGPARGRPAGDASLFPFTARRPAAVMALFSCSAARRAAWPARELAARGGPAARSAGRAGPARRRPMQCRCDAVDQQDGVTAGAPAPLLTSKTAQRLKVSMMSLGCPKNVVDGALAQRKHAASAPGASRHRRCRAPTAIGSATLWRSRGGPFSRVGWFHCQQAHN